MADIKKYVKKNGESAYKFQVYTGVNPLTGKQGTTTRRGFKTKREASIELKRIEALVATDSFYDDSKGIDFTFEEVYYKWWEGYKHTVKESTLRTTEGHFKHRILPALGNNKIKKITTYMLQQTANSWADYANVKRWLTYTNVVFKYALTINALDKNPMNGVIRPAAKPKQDKKSFWSKEELRLFMSGVEDYHVVQAMPLFRLLAFCGLRRGEALALEWNDVDFTNKTLSINKTMTRGRDGQYIGPPKNRSSNRIISLDNKTIQILQNHKNDYTRIFTNEYGGFLSSSKPRVWLQSICKKIDLEPIHIHGLRHTHASLLFEAGANIKEVQARLGHQNTKITLDIYTHVTKESRDSFAEEFSSFIDF